jgi:RNA polymerase sigma-70 factor (ECF subfamily)
VDARSIQLGGRAWRTAVDPPVALTPADARRPGANTMTADELAATFAAVWGDRDAGDLRPNTGVKLLALCNRARLAHPTIANDPQLVVAIAMYARAATAGSITAVDAFLDRCHPEDLALAVAATRGEPAAIAEIERAYRMTIDSTCRRFQTAAHSADELKEILRDRLFVSEAGRAPKIGDYAGQGQLEDWLRVTAVRVFLDLAKRRARRASEAPQLALDHVQPMYREAVAHAMFEAARQLAPGDRHLLRQHFVARLSIDQLGAVLGIDRETAARRIGRAREKLVTDTRAALARRLALHPDDLDGVIGLVLDRIDASIGKLFETPP